MTEHDGSPIPEADATLLRRVPARAHLIARRLRRLHAGGWDINALALIQDEAGALGEGSAALALDEAADALARIAGITAELVQDERLPESDTADALLALADAVSACMPEPEPEVMQVEYEAVELRIETLTEETPPALAPDTDVGAPDPEPDLWGDDASNFAAPSEPSPVARAAAPASAPVDSHAAAAQRSGSFSTAPPAPVRGQAQTLAAPAAPTPPAPRATPARRGGESGLPAGFRLYHLSEYGSVSLELDQRFEGMGVEIELLEQVEELTELLGAVPADLVLIDALFAEGILRNAGMDSLVVIDALDVMPALRNFRPDLVLMDLNMPGANGIELTALIREQEAFAHTPIVFLSGEASEDLQFDAIDAGGDDFLSKPIRPRHLISAVQTRVRRHRQQESRRVRRPDKDAATGLVYRKTLLEQLDACLAAGESTGGLVFLEVEGLALLRERIGLTALEILLGDVSRLLTQRAGDLPTTRFGDGSWLLLDRSREELALDSLATDLRSVLMGHAFQALGHPLRLRLSAGVAALRHGFAEAGAMINAVEKVAREARTQDRGVRRYEPPRASDAVREAALLELVREAIRSESLVLLYQPVVAVAGGDVSQYQALLRLRDASGGLRPAAEIIPMAERTGLIVEIDRWVAMQAISLIRQRHDEGAQLRLFVTQSPLTLAAAGQADWLRHEISSAGIPGDCLVVEVRLEDAAMHAAAVRQFCDAMATTRVQFCLSQFEGGPDAARLAAQLPLSFVKLARKYTAGSLNQGLRDELKALIDSAHGRRLEVIGHGVEDAQAAATLWMSGIDFIQGNLVQQADAGMDFDFHQAVL